MESQPCKVCGGKDLSLVDGYYYCVECGTQDVDVRETIIVEQTLRADGTFTGITTSKKVTKVLGETIDMSGEWKKWHAYNFILSGLTEELLAVGAKPSVKKIVLWVWIRYIKMFQKKEELGKKTQFEEDTLNESIQGENDKPENENSETENKANSKNPTETKKETKFRFDINVITKGTFLAILYVALNLDRSDIQLSHLFRFVKEGRLSIMPCTKFIPKEINTKTIPQWKNFDNKMTEYEPRFIREIAMTFFKRLNLGVPLVPDLTNMIENYIKELCLPHDFKHLVISLMKLFPYDFLELKSMVRVPDYEAVCMSYILVALKMCFGLDGDYEQMLSDEVGRINCQENKQKAYKLGFYSNMSDRLFSFHEWAKFMQFRKIILSKNYLPMANMYNLPVDDCVFMEHTGERRSRRVKLSDEVTMDILNKINVNDDVSVIPKKQFPVTLTARTTYTDIIIERIQDPDFKLLLSEDFTQYSLKYAIEELKFLASDYSSINIIQGVTESNKTFNPYIIGTLEVKKGDKTMVFVRNCENKNWLKTKPPTMKHVTKMGENQNRSDKDSTSGYDSNLECSPVEITETENIDKEDLEDERELETFEEEDEEKIIFDDDFINIDDNDFFNNPGNIEHQESKVNSVNEILHEEPYNDEEQESTFMENFHDFDPQRFDRDKVLQELIEMAYIKNKIPKERKPEKYNKENIKNRKRNLENDDMQMNVKRPKLRTESRKETQQLIFSYYEKLQNDVLHHISTEVRSFLNITSTANQNESVIADPTDQNGYNASAISSIHPSTTLNETNIDEEEIEESVTKTNPNFDPKTHNIKQLFIKLTDDSFLAENFDYVDDDIDKLLENKIKESSSQETAKVDTPFDTSDSEDNIPLSELQEKINRLARRKRKIKGLQMLIKNKELNEFYYWMRHYKSRAFTRSEGMTTKFDRELVENYPMSFVFVIRECAAVVNCTPFFLYRHMQTIEQCMIKFKG